jgi:hypothetical protein
VTLDGGQWTEEDASQSERDCQQTRGRLLAGSLIALLALLRVAGAYRAGWLSWVSALAGAWLTVSAFAVAGSGIALWNSFVFGITVFGLAWWSARLSDQHTNG